MQRLPCLMLASLLLVLELALPVARASELPDAAPPLIEHERRERVEAGDRQSFTAQVVDDRQLGAVSLHHRREGERIFANVPMTPLARSAFYGVAIETDPDDTRTIEYYVQAFDAAGNRTVSGYAFDPLLRQLRAPSRPLVVDRSVEPEHRIRTGKVRWWQIALGAIAVGTLAALASGGSDDGASSGSTRAEPNDDRVPFTITLGEPR